MTQSSIRTFLKFVAVTVRTAYLSETLHHWKHRPSPARPVSPIARKLFASCEVKNAVASSSGVSAVRGAARNEDNSARLWTLLSEIGAVVPLCGIESPAALWFTSYQWPDYDQHGRNMYWLDDFEQSTAYVWVNHSRRFEHAPNPNKQTTKPARAGFRGKECRGAIVHRSGRAVSGHGLVAVTSDLQFTQRNASGWGAATDTVYLTSHELMGTFSPLPAID